MTGHSPSFVPPSPGSSPHHTSELLAYILISLSLHRTSFSRVLSSFTCKTVSGLKALLAHLVRVNVYFNPLKLGLYLCLHCFALHYTALHCIALLKAACLTNAQTKSNHKLGTFITSYSINKSVLSFPPFHPSTAFDLFTERLQQF